MHELSALSGPTPANDLQARKATLDVVTGMMLTLPMTRQNDISAELCGEAYMTALDDLPTWAVYAARRRWWRGDCGMNERGVPYDTHWCPAPAELRKIAMRELWRILEREGTLKDLLRAEPRIEYSEQHCDAMRLRLSSLVHEIGIPKPPVGLDDGSGGKVDANTLGKVSPGSERRSAGADCGASSTAQPGPDGVRVTNDDCGSS
jgi:hypothetical protein